MLSVTRQLCPDSQVSVSWPCPMYLRLPLALKVTLRSNGFMFGLWVTPFAAAWRNKLSAATRSAGSVRGTTFPVTGSFGSDGTDATARLLSETGRPGDPRPCDDNTEGNNVSVIKLAKTTIMVKVTF